MSGDTPGDIKTRKNALKHKCHKIEYLMCQDTRFVTRHESVSWDVACLRIVFDVSRHRCVTRHRPYVLGHSCLGTYTGDLGCPNAELTLSYLIAR